MEKLEVDIEIGAEIGQNGSRILLNTIFLVLVISNIINTLMI